MKQNKKLVNININNISILYNSPYFYFTDLY